MTNYEAIQKLSPEHLAYILDSIYVAGLNDGLYAGRLEGCPEQAEILDNHPFDRDWLLSEAEDATRYVFAGGGDPYVLKALAEAILRNAGVEEDAEEAGEEASGFNIKFKTEIEEEIEVLQG